MIPVRPEHTPWWWGALVTVGVALLVAARHSGWRYRSIGLALLAAAGWWGLSGFVAAEVPADWLQPVREGFTPDHLRYALADSSDTGKMPQKILSPLLAPQLFGLRQAVARNLTCHGWACLLLGALMHHRVGRPGPAVLFATVVLLGPLGLTAALSEVNASVVALLLAALGCLLPLALGTAGPPHPAPAAARPGPAWSPPVARLVILLGTLLAASALAAVRDEWVLGTLVVVLALLLARSPWRPRWTPRVDAVGARLRRQPWLVGVAVAGWVLASWFWHEPPADVIAADRQAAWVILGMHPLNVQGLLLPLVLLATMSPGLVLLAGRGAWQAARHPVRHAFAPAVLWVLFVSAWIAGHGRIDLDAPGAVAPWELYRYMLSMAPLVWMLAVAGSSPATPRGLLLTLLLPPLPWLRDLLETSPEASSRWPVLLPAVAGAAPDEVRALVGLVDEHDRGRRCTILSAGRAWGPDARWTWSAIRWYQGRRPRYEQAPWHERDRLTEGAPCLVFWYGLDCSAAEGQCPGWAAQITAPGTAPFVPFVHPDHGMTWTTGAPITTGVVVLDALLESPAPPGGG